MLPLSQRLNVQRCKVIIKIKYTQGITIHKVDVYEGSSKFHKKDFQHIRIYNPILMVKIYYKDI